MISKSRTLIQRVSDPSSTTHPPHYDIGRGRPLVYAIAAPSTFGPRDVPYAYGTLALRNKNVSMNENNSAKKVREF